jgi:lysophospholipase L1-like esterase
MKKYLFLLFIPMLAFMVPAKKKKVIFFGDSITQAGIRPGGYIPRIDTLAQKAGRGQEFDWIGAGVSGNKVYDLYLRLEEDVLDKKPDIVLIYIGVNDVWHKDKRGTGTDFDKFGKFYEALVRKIRGVGAKVIVCTPAVIGEKKDNVNPQDKDLNEYSQWIRDFAAREKLPLVDLRSIFTQYDQSNNPQNLEKGILTNDGVHLNDTGNQTVAEAMWKAIGVVSFK